MEYKLIGVDMDGTLLDSQGNIPEDFWQLHTELSRLGVTITPASGRQLATLQSMFDHLNSAGQAMSYIAENGTVVVHQGKVIDTTTLPPHVVRAVIDAIQGHNLHLVICTPFVGYINRAAQVISREIDTYYHSLEVVDDLHQVPTDEVVKLAIYSEENAETYSAPIVRDCISLPDAHLAISGPHWIDIMNPAANKGLALRQLAAHLGLRTEQTLAFGDYLNDLELLQSAGTAIAMENAHPKIKEIADRIAPPNTEQGVIQVLREMFTA